MTKVYIVTNGYYEDYSINRVFLDKEKAEKYIKLIDDYYDNPEIEEYDTDDNKVIDKIIYVEGKYIKDSKDQTYAKDGVEVKVKITNTLDNCPEDINDIYFNKSYSFGNELVIDRVISNEDFDEDLIVKKYEKILYDLMPKIENLLSKGWDEKMIGEWLWQNADDYVNK